MAYFIFEEVEKAAKKIKADYNVAVNIQKELVDNISEHKQRITKEF